MEQLLLEHKKTQLSKEELEERNKEIIRLWREEHLTYEVIGAEVGLSKVRVGEILRETVLLTKRNKEWEKEKRINTLWREVEKKKNEDSKKDKVEILEQLRKEFEGEEKNPSITINRVEVLIEYGTPNIQNQEKRSDSQGNFIDIEASSMLGK